MLETCDMKDDLECPKTGKHRDHNSSQTKKSGCAVKKIMEDKSHFTNPWKIADKEKIILPCIWGSCFRRNRQRYSSG